MTISPLVEQPIPWYRMFRISPDKVETMQQMPWETPIYRNRHGRGTRTPMFGTRLPRYRTRSGMFDDMLVAQIRRLNGAWPELIAPVQFAVEDVPPSDPAPWEDVPHSVSSHFPPGTAFHPVSCCTACRCNRMPVTVWTCNSQSGTRWSHVWRKSTDAVRKK